MSTRRSFLKIAAIATTTESVLDGKELTFERTQSGLIDVETEGTYIVWRAIEGQLIEAEIKPFWLMDATAVDIHSQYF